ncbi:cyclin-domain-containing protein [Backusella circina FSU 941]|nr:cyclin-domain-containing protein [Backusella circina FSU 941]
MNSDLHYDLARYPTKDTIKMLTLLLDTAIKANDALESHHDRRKSNAFACFYAKSIPSISIQAYLTRILKYCPCSNECFLAVLIYLERLKKPTPTRAGLHIDSYNIHRLLIAGIMVASKLFSDVFFTNTRYAKVGGLPASELNVLEIEFLSLNDFSLYVSLDELQRNGDELLEQWKQNDTQPSSKLLETPEDALAPPVRRRARHLSIDKHVEMADNMDNHRVYKRPTCNSSPPSGVAKE